MSDIFGLVAEMVKNDTLAANAIAEDVAKRSVNVGKVVSEMREDPNTTDPETKAYQEWVEKARAAIEARIAKENERLKAKIPASSMSDEEREAKHEEYKTHKASIAKAKALAAIQPGYSEDIFKDVPDLLTFKGKASASGGSGQTGISRPRFESIEVNGQPVSVEKENAKGETVTVSNLTVVAQFISKDSGVKVKASDLQDVAFEVAGTHDLSTVNDVDFNYSVTDSEGQTHEYSIHAFPRQAK